MKYFLIIISCFLLSCSEVIELDLRDVDPALVIYGYVTDQPQTQHIEVSRTISTFDTLTNNRVVGAEVFVTSSKGEVFEYQERIDSLGHYFSVNEFAAEQGVVYTMTVNYDFDEDFQVESYTASTELQSKARLTNARVVSAYQMGMTYYVPYFDCEGTSEGEYWFVYFKLNGESLFDSFEDADLVDAQSLIGSEAQTDIPLANFNFQHLFFSEADKDMFGESSSMEPVFVSPGDTITFVVGSIDRDFYDFYSAVYQGLSASNPVFGSSSVFLPTNISGGAMGYFGSMAMLDLDMIVE